MRAGYSHRGRPWWDAFGTDPPRWEGRALDFYYWHFGTLALHLLEGPDGRNWKAWEGGLKKVLVERQGLGGCKDGSWEPADFWSDQGGRVYAAALNALTVETARRYPPGRFRR